MLRKFLEYFRNAMVLVYLAMAGVILFTPVFDHLMPNPRTKILVALVILLYSVFRVYRVYRLLKDSEKNDL